MRSTRLKSFVYCLLSLCWMGTPDLGWSAPVDLIAAIKTTLAEHPTLNRRPFELRTPELSAIQTQCPDWQVDLPNKSRMLGLLKLQVSCATNPRLNRTLWVNVLLTGPVLVASRNLSPGQSLQSSDWKIVQSELSKLPPDVLEDESEIENKEIVRFVRAGTPLMLNDLRSITVIKYGDLVKLSFVGDGFTVSTSGQALGPAALGDTVKVRTQEGKLIQGKAVAKDEVEVVLDQR